MREQEEVTACTDKVIRKVPHKSRSRSKGRPTLVSHRPKWKGKSQSWSSPFSDKTDPFLLIADVVHNARDGESVVELISTRGRLPRCVRDELFLRVETRVRREQASRSFPRTPLEGESVACEYGCACEERKAMRHRKMEIEDPVADP